MKKILKIVGIFMAVVALLSALAFATGKKIEHDRKIALIALCEDFYPGMPQQKLEQIILTHYPSAVAMPLAFSPRPTPEFLPSATAIPLVFSPQRHTPELLVASVELVLPIDEESHLGPLLVRRYSRTGATIYSRADGYIYHILAYDDADFHASVLILGQWHTLPLPKYEHNFSAQPLSCAVRF